MAAGDAMTGQSEAQELVMPPDTPAPVMAFARVCYSFRVVVSRAAESVDGEVARVGDWRVECDGQLGYTLRNEGGRWAVVWRNDGMAAGDVWENGAWTRALLPGTRQDKDSRGAG